MADKEIVEHPSAKMGEGRVALRRGDIKGAASVLQDVAPESRLRDALAMVVAYDSNLPEAEQVVRIADALISLYGTDSVSQAKRLAESFSDSDFSRAVLAQIQKRQL